MKALSVLIFIIGFLLFRPYQMERYGIMYPGDDRSYMAHATSIVFGQFPSYSNEYLEDATQRPPHSVGPGLAAAPVMLPFSWIDRLSGSAIVLQRNSATLVGSWTEFGFVISSVMYLWLGCFFLYRGLRHHVGGATAVWSIALVVLAEGIPLFAYRRPVFGHISAFCVMGAMMCWLVTPRESLPKPLAGWAGAATAGLLAGMLMLIRPSHVITAMVWCLALLYLRHREGAGRGVWGRVVLAWGVIGLMRLGVLFWVGVSNGYAHDVFSRLLAVHPPLFYLQRCWHVLAGIDWGLVYTAPFLLAGVVWLGQMPATLRRPLVWVAATLLVNIYTILAWGTQAGWYGYRYLVPVAAPVLVFPFALLLDAARRRWGAWRAGVLTVLVGLLPFMSMLAFEGNSVNLTLFVFDQGFGYEGWGNPSYQWEVWKTMVTQPLPFAVAVLKGGPLFVLVHLRWIFGETALFPFVVQQMYTAFSPLLLARVLLLYSVPLVLYGLLGREKPALPAEGRRRPEKGQAWA